MFEPKPLTSGTGARRPVDAYLGELSGLCVQRQLECGHVQEAGPPWVANTGGREGAGLSGCTLAGQPGLRKGNGPGEELRLRDRGLKHTITAITDRVMDGWRNGSPVRLTGLRGGLHRRDPSVWEKTVVQTRIVYYADVRRLSSSAQHRVVCGRQEGFGTHGGSSASL